MDIRKDAMSTHKITPYKGVMKAILTEIGFAAGGFLAGRATLPFGAAPFGFALVCCSGKHTLSVFSGVCLSAFLHTDRAVLLAAYTLALVLRIAISLPYVKRSGGTYTVGGIADGLFSEPPSLRIVIAAVSAFSVGLWRWIRGGFLYYHLFGALLLITVAAIGAFLWRALPWVDRSEAKSRLHKSLAWLTACGVAVFALRGWSIYGISLSALLCILICLAITHKKGIAFGATTAIFSGLAVSVAYAPLFVFAAICYGFLSSVRTSLGCFAAVGVAMAWGIHTGGIGFVTSLLPAIMSGCLLFFVGVKLFGKTDVQAQSESKDVAPSPENSTSITDDVHIAAARLDDAAKKIKALCQGLSSISEALLSSEAYTKDHRDNSESPLTEGYSAEFGEEHVVAHSDAIPINGGKKYTDISTEINDRLSSHSHSTSSEERTEARALDLRAISDYLARIMISNDSEYIPDTELGKKIADKLISAYPNINPVVCALGGERKRIIVSAHDGEFLQRNCEDILRHTEDICGFRLVADEPFDVGGSYYLTFYQRPVLDALISRKSQRSARETEFCGDSVGIINDSDNGKIFAFISDGMGSGRSAAMTSELCTLFLQKLLPINCSYMGDTSTHRSHDTGGDAWIRTTIEMLNGFLRSRGGVGEDECSATIDLGVLDLINGRIGFYKSGAAPTYVFRDGSLFKLGSRTFPIGIIKDPDVGSINMELLPGDVIVMVSDGVTGGREECPELFEMLRSRIATHSSEQLAEAVIRYAEDTDSPDDISVIVIKVQEKVFE